jgi:hypothetical protein
VYVVDLLEQVSLTHPVRPSHNCFPRGVVTVILSTIKIKSFLIDKININLIMIALNIKTNYKNAILIVIQSSMSKIKISKNKLSTVKPLILG